MPQQVTETQAMTKVCPYLSVGKNLVRCAGTECMAWQPVYRAETGGKMVKVDNLGFCGRPAR